MYIDAQVRLLIGLLPWTSALLVGALDDWGDTGRTSFTEYPHKLARIDFVTATGRITAIYVEL